jgi:hypothetical protein
VNIIRDYRLSDWPASTLNALPAPELIELIVSTVKVRTDVVPR